MAEFGNKMGANLIMVWIEQVSQRLICWSIGPQLVVLTQEVVGSLEGQTSCKEQITE